MATLTDPENDMTNQTNTALSSGARLYVYILWGRRGRDHMVVGFITTYAISAYHH